MDFVEEIRFNEQHIISEVGDKYNYSGLYTISIDNTLAYIGKSANMQKRIAHHMFHIYHPELKEGKGHKYEVFREAIANGHKINFNRMAKNYFGEELGELEGEAIRGYMPPLNYQIPKEEDWHKYDKNYKALTVNYKEIVH